MTGHIVKGVLAFKSEDGDRVAAAIQSLDGIGIEPLGNDEAIAIFGAGEGDAFNRFTGLGLSFLRVDDDSTEEASQALGCLAEPIHGLEPHYHNASGDPRPRPFHGVIDLAAEIDDTKGVVAIVDTGLAPNVNRPGWLSDASGVSGEHDLGGPPPDIPDPGIPDPANLGGGPNVGPNNDPPPSHGTYIASVIRQMLPTHAISLKRPGVMPAANFLDDVGVPGRLRKLTSEWHVADAILRLIEEHERNDPPPVGLNISMGGELATGSEAMLLLSLAVNKWLATFKTAPIVASAGNKASEDNVYPAALPGVISVAAADSDGNEIVWTDSDAQPPEVANAPVQAQAENLNRTWVSELAPGLDVAGCSGFRRSDFICWGGSSPAAAIALAARLQGERPRPEGRLLDWTDCELDGLTICPGAQTAN